MPVNIKENTRQKKEAAFIEKASAMPQHINDDYSRVHFINKTTKVEIFCKKCQKSYWQTPKLHEQGQSCPICSIDKIKSRNKDKWQKFMQKSHDRFGDRYDFPFIQTEYQNSHSKITIVCKKCGAKFTKIASDHITSTNGGCKNCWKDDSGYMFSYEDLKPYINGNAIKPFIGKLHKSYDTVTAICPIHGEYTASLKAIIDRKSYKCTKCNGSDVRNSKKITNIKERLDIILQGRLTFDENDYNGTNKPMQFTCTQCGFTFNRRPNTILSSHVTSCPRCSKKQQSLLQQKTTEQFIEDVKTVYGEEKYEILGEYTGSTQKIEIKCLECGRIFTKEANSFLQGNGCPFHNNNSSGKEKEIVEFIQTLGITDVLTNDRSLINPLELDIYIPSKRLAIEFDGIFWHNENNKPDFNYHLNKTIQCNEKNVRLIHIFEDEWIEKPEIWKSMLRNILGQTKYRIYARNCVIKEVSPTDATRFLDNNHIQGRCPSQIRYGLYHNDELVSLMSFGSSRHFIGNGLSQYELLRFCNKINTSVIGGASKLFKHFIKLHDPINIVSYADRRWSLGNLYNALGFRLMHESKPNYFYVIGMKRKNRFNFRKSILVKKYGCPIDMSERDFCKQQNWPRIYDCGCLCYKWQKDEQ